MVAACPDAAGRAESFDMQLLKAGQVHADLRVIGRYLLTKTVLRAKW